MCSKARGLVFVVAAALAASACVADEDPSTSDATRVDVVSDVSSEEVLAAAQRWMDTQTTPAAAAFVDLVDAADDPRFAPWLLDLMRLGRNTVVDDHSSEILARWSGIAPEARILDLNAYGGWLRDEGIDGGEGYREFKVVAYSEIDERFGPLLAEVADQAELAAIQWGGVPLGGIPQLDDPARLAPADAPWMEPDEIVLGVELDGEAVAYPLRIILHHELVNDTVGGREIAVVYCTLCRTGLVFDAAVGGSDRTFLTSGLLLDSNKLMVDVETGSLWHHLRGLGVAGPETGTALDTLPAEHRTWAEWLDAHPDTEVLDLPDPIFFDEPERPPIAFDYRPGAAYESYYRSDELWFPVAEFGDELPAKALVLGLSHDGHHLAVDIDALGAPGEEATVEVGGAMFTIVATSGGAEAFDEAGRRADVLQGFWFAWHGLHPDTSVWPSG